MGINSNTKAKISHIFKIQDLELMSNKQEKIVLIGSPGTDFAHFEEFFLTENSFQNLQRYIQKISRTKKEKLYNPNLYSPFSRESPPNFGLDYQEENFSYAYSHFCKIIELCPNKVVVFLSQLSSSNQVLNNTVNAFLDGYLHSLDLGKDRLLDNKESLVEQVLIDLQQKFRSLFLCNLRDLLEIVYISIDLSDKNIEYFEYKPKQLREQEIIFEEKKVSETKTRSLEVKIVKKEKERTIIGLNLEPTWRKEYVLKVRDRSSYQKFLARIKADFPKESESEELERSCLEIFELLEFQQKQKVKTTWWKKPGYPERLDLVLDSSDQANSNSESFYLSNQGDDLLNYLLLFFDYFKVSKSGKKLSLRKSFDFPALLH